MTGRTETAATAAFEPARLVLSRQILEVACDTYSLVARRRLRPVHHAQEHALTVNRDNEAILERFRDYRRSRRPGAAQRAGRGAPLDRHPLRPPLRAPRRAARRPRAGRPARRAQGGRALRPRARRRLPVVRHADGDGRAAPPLPRPHVVGGRAPPAEGAARFARARRRASRPDPGPPAEGRGAGRGARRERRTRSSRPSTPAPPTGRRPSAVPTTTTRSASRPSLGEEDVGLADADVRLAARRLIATLPQRERTIVYLRFFGGLTQQEIAERLGMSQVHVSRLLRQCLARLRTELADEPVG